MILFKANHRPIWASDSSSVKEGATIDDVISLSTMKFYDRRIESWVSLSFDKCVRRGEMSVLVLHSLPKSGLNPVGLLHAKQHAKL